MQNPGKPKIAPPESSLAMLEGFLQPGQTITLDIHRSPGGSLADRFHVGEVADYPYYRSAGSGNTIASAIFSLLEEIEKNRPMDEDEFTDVARRISIGDRNIPEAVMVKFMNKIRENGMVR